MDGPFPRPLRPESSRTERPPKRSFRERSGFIGNKHPAPDEQPVELTDDLERNPGIGQSKGLFGGKDPEDSKLIEGESTVEGDIENDSSLGQGADRDLGRTNE